MAYYCEKGTHRSVHQCLLDKCILESMGFEVEVVDLCRWHHLVQGCAKGTNKVCDDCQRDNPISVTLRKFGVMEFFECVELADSLCSNSFHEKKTSAVFIMGQLNTPLYTHFYILMHPLLHPLVLLHGADQFWQCYSIICLLGARLLHE